ncbi:MAG: DUF2950 family protein [bacterium]|nr:DUF2950 family protein [bacterium]
MSRSITTTLAATMLLTACAHTPPRVPQTPPGPMTFATPRDAVSALVDACRADDVARVEAIFGERDLVLSGDQAADADHCRRFVQAADAMTRLDPWGDRRLVLVVGSDDFAFPVPLVERGDRWQFDPEAGAAEVLRRRAGENELGAIGRCRAWTHDPAAHAGIDPARPLHGYYFEQLTARGGGRALLAWPAEYRVTGVQSFLVGPDGLVREKDLGPNGPRGITSWTADDTWRVVEAN